MCRTAERRTAAAGGVGVALDASGTKASGVSRSAARCVSSLDARFDGSRVGRPTSVDLREAEASRAST